MLSASSKGKLCFCTLEAPDFMIPPPRLEAFPILCDGALKRQLNSKIGALKIVANSDRVMKGNQFKVGNIPAVYMPLKSQEA